MVYSRYGFSFSLLKEDDIELVRRWRNDPVVSNNFEFRDHITPEMQKEWFRSIHNVNNLYTIIGYQGEKIGVINLKNIDWETRTGEGGIFLPDVKYHQTIIPAIISYISTEIIFVMFEWKIGYAHVLKENKSVQQFVSLLGYELMPRQEDVLNQKYRITSDSFEKRRPKLLKAISALVGNDKAGVFCVEPVDYADPVVLQWEDKVRTNRFISQFETTEEGRFYYFS